MRLKRIFSTALKADKQCVIHHQLLVNINQERNEWKHTNRQLLQTVLSVVEMTWSLYFLFQRGDNYPSTIDFIWQCPVSSKRTKKLCLPQLELFWFGMQSSAQALKISNNVKLEYKTEEITMFKNSSAVLLLLWLLVAPFFFQIEGNSTSPLPKVSFKIQERKQDVDDKRETARMLSSFFFNPQIKHTKMEWLLLLFIANKYYFTLLYTQLKRDGKSFIFAVCCLP